MMKISAIAILVAAVSFSVSCAVVAGDTRGWSSPENGVEIVALPSGWKKETSNAQTLRMTKTFERAGLEFDERMTVQVARDTYGSVENAISDLRGEGYYLVDRTRLSIDQLGVPFWFMNRPVGDEESAWCALFLRGGRVYLIELRASLLDADALSDYSHLIENFHLLPDQRTTGWNALEAGDAPLAEREFRALLGVESEDLNARYGLGLAYLAQGRADDAVRELERVRPQFGLDEDVRRALGRAELARGNASRGVTLLVQVLRDDPAWDPELRPQIFAGIRAASPVGGARTAGGALSPIAIEFMSRLTRGDAFVLQTLRAAFGREFQSAIDTCLSNPCDANALVQIVAGLDFDQGMSLGLAARGVGGAESFEAAQAKFADGFKFMTLLGR
jgi:tetratricopeptide (TPR) repeat protein